MYREDDGTAELEKEKKAERVKQFYKEWESYCQATKKADPMSVQQSEADSTNKNSLDKCQENNDLAIFKRPATPPMPNNRSKSKALTVGTQTWAITRVINSMPSTPNETYIAPKPSSGLSSKPSPNANCVPVMQAQHLGERRTGNVNAMNFKPKITIKSMGIKGKPVVELKSMVFSAKEYRPVKSVGFPVSANPGTKRVGTISSTMYKRRVGPRKSASKTGRYAYATVLKSVSSAAATNPSRTQQQKKD